MKTAVFGIFPTRANAEMGLDSLRLSGFGNGEISALLPGGEGIGGVVSWLIGVVPPVSVEKSVPTEPVLAGPLVPGLPVYCRDRVKQGAILVAVHCNNHDRIELAAQVLRRSGAEDVTVPGLRRAEAAA